MIFLFFISEHLIDLMLLGAIYDIDLPVQWITYLRNFAPDYGQ